MCLSSLSNRKTFRDHHNIRSLYRALNEVDDGAQSEELTEIEDITTDAEVQFILLDDEAADEIRPEGDDIATRHALFGLGWNPLWYDHFIYIRASAMEKWTSEDYFLRIMHELEHVAGAPKEKCVADGVELNRRAAKYLLLLAKRSRALKFLDPDKIKAQARRFGVSKEDVDNMG